MRRIIPIIIFFTAIAYLFYSPAPMNKIGKIVKTRDCYQLRFLDQKRLPLPSENMINDNSTASTQQKNPSKVTSKKPQKQHDFSLALVLKAIKDH